MNANLLADQVTRVVERASLAPSIHNSQPWLFRSSGPTLQIWADRRRHLHGIDPTGRQLTVSIGAAVEYARLALRAEGFDVECALCPDPTVTDLMATLTVTRPLAVDSVTRSLVHAMPRRATYRDAFDARPVPAAVISRLREAAHEVGCGTHVVSEGQQAELIGLLERAELTELMRADYRHELERWRSHEVDAVDGVPDAAIPTQSRRVSRMPIRRFDLDQVRTPDPASVDDPVVLAITTTTDETTDWLLAGRGLAQVLLHATLAGVQASPLTQSLDNPLDRHRTGRALGLLGYAQMVLRLGYGRPAPTSPRRPVSETLTRS